MRRAVPLDILRSQCMVVDNVYFLAMIAVFYNHTRLNIAAKVPVILLRHQMSIDMLHSIL